MNDDDLLRDSLARISEQATPVDLLDRSLSRSKRIGRNQRIMTGIAAVVALAAAGGVAWQLNLSPADHAAPGAEHSPTPSAVASPTPSEVARTAPVSPPTSTSPSRPADGCPVSAATLLSVLQAWPSYSSLEPTNQLTNVRCYKGYAMARTNGVHTGPARIVFQYHASSTAWSVLTAGTADLCTQVPADVKPQLGGC
jgi:hypothetical protein